MGMTIEEAIEFKKHGYHTPLSSFKNIDDMNAQISKCYEYDRLALETMRKLQKIEQIANDKNINGDLLRMSEIRWVLKDGSE